MCYSDLGGLLEEVAFELGTEGEGRKVLTGLKRSGKPLEKAEAQTLCGACGPTEENPWA